MTKQTADETTLKYHMTVEEANKASESNNAFAACGAQVNSELEEKIKVTSIRNEIKSKRNRLGKIMPKLYNLENGVETEKPVKINLDLDLYQMEKV